MAERVEVTRDTAGEYRWKHIAVNENVIATSGEGYVNLLHAIRMAKQENPGVPVFEVYVDEKAAE